MDGFKEIYIKKNKGGGLSLVNIITPLLRKLSANLDENQVRVNQGAGCATTCNATFFAKIVLRNLVSF